MPIARNPAEHNHNWIPREAEAEFNNLLKDGKAYVLPLVGVGGAGKTSLLRRFFNYCERYDVPAVYIDLPRLTVSSAVDMWLRLETVHTKAFDEQRKKLNTSYETLTAMLQTYGDNASSAADLLQKSMGKDEHYGLAVGALRDAGKLLYEFWQRKENQQHQTLLKKPEEALLAALASDFTKHGVILIDTLEQASKQNLQTRLTFCEDGGLETPVAENPHALSLLDYCAGMAHFLFDKPVVMVMAGRPPAIRELGALPVEYFAPTVVVPAFTAAEIRTYLEKSLPRHIASPQDSDISKLQQLTLGNPFLLERVVRLLADWQPLWEWQAQQWQPLLNGFQHDERHGLLLYVTQRLLTHVLPDDRAFWRLALPRQFIHRDMAELLFPKAEFGEQSGLQRLKTYEEKGTVYREQDPDRYFLHDETRAAFSAWAKRENVWLDKAACEIHAQLAAWFDQQSGWPEQYPDPIAKTPENGNPLLLEGAYHTFMADPSFAIRERGQDKEAFWKMLAGSLYRANAWKRQRVDLLPTEEPRKTSALLQADWEFCSKRFHSHTAQYLTQKASRGDLPANWQDNEFILRELLKNIPDDPEVLKLLVEIKSLTVDEREQHHKKLIELAPNNAYRLGSFARFMHYTRKDYDRAEALYAQATVADPKNEFWLDSFARFMHYTRKDYDRAEALYEQALAAAPKHARNLGNFAVFMMYIRKDYDRAEMLYAQAIEADPTNARNLGNFALFMMYIRKDYDRAELLYEQSIEVDPKNARNLGNFAYFMHYIRKDYDRAELLYAQLTAADPEYADGLGNFAVFMANVRKDYDRAELLYEQSIEVDPTNARNLGRFAIFLHLYRKNYPQAKQLYHRVLAIEPNETNNMGNLAQLYLLEGDKTQAKALIDQAFALNPEAVALKLELWFYRFAHFPEDYPQAVTEIMTLLETGERDEGWDFSGNIAQAEEDGHPKVALLQALADVITGKAELDSLDNIA